MKGKTLRVAGALILLPFALLLLIVCVYAAIPVVLAQCAVDRMRGI